jgi:hypothetical protein
MIRAILYVCIAVSGSDDPHVYHQPEAGMGHVAYSYSMSFFDLAREAVNECEALHGDEQCDVLCYISRSRMEGQSR